MYKITIRAIVSKLS